MTTARTVPAEQTLEQAQLWIDRLREVSTHVRWDAGQFADAADRAAQTYVKTGVAFIDLQPGDGTRYPILLTDLRRAAPGVSVGGELGVTLFEHPIKGTPVALGLPCFVMPTDVQNWLGITRDHTAGIVAVFLTLFSESVDWHRAN